MIDRTYRVLVTISRGFGDIAVIHHALDQQLAYAESLGRCMTLVHGDCKPDSDAIADAWAVKRGRAGRPVLIEPHPAQNHPTEDFGPWPGAGPKRNNYMVSLGANVCHAFISACTSMRCRRQGEHPSHGATQCANAAESAGIMVDRTYRRPSK